MIALLDKRLVYPVRVFKPELAQYGNPWEYFLALDPCEDEPGVCELIGWQHQFMVDKSGKTNTEVARACVKLAKKEGYKILKSTHYENGVPRVKYVQLTKKS